MENSKALTIDEQLALGAAIVELLHLKAKGGRFNTTYGTKTVQGIGATIERIYNEIKEQKGTANPDKISIIWSVEDVLTRAEEMHETTISLDQARWILEQLEINHDCNYGITWEIMDDYISCLLYTSPSPRDA